MYRHIGLALAGALASTVSLGADRAIAVPAKVAASWGFVTNSTKVQPSRILGVGFWQRGSGAKPGVGDVFVTAMEFQLPEAAPGRIRSASFQFSGKPAQCVGAEPVVIDIYAYAGDGRGDVGDANVGSRVAQMRADCSDRSAFSQPVDVTAIVRQTTVASGIRFVGFNVRKANNRQGPGLFHLVPGKLTVVIAERDRDERMDHAGSAGTKAMPVAAGAHVPAATHRRAELLKAQQR